MAYDFLRLRSPGGIGEMQALDTKLVRGQE
jgi:hypothetical protein